MLDEDSSVPINLKSIESPTITSMNNTSSTSPTSLTTFQPLIDTQGKTTRKKKNARIQSELYYMEKNKIEYQRRTSDFGNSLLQKTMTEILGKGDYFGGSSILNNKCKSLYRYVANKHTVCLTLSKEIFEEQIVRKVYYYLFIYISIIFVIENSRKISSQPPNKSRQNPSQNRISTQFHQSRKTRRFSNKHQRIKIYQIPRSRFIWSYSTS